MKFKIVVGLLLILQACVYDFDPDVSNYENRLVVYSLISNLPEIVEAKLSRTMAINDIVATPETGAEISISNRQGVILQLNETGSGVYTSSELFQAIEGEEYKLTIQTSDGSVYESDFETLTTSYPIANITYDFESYETNELDEIVKGYRFYVDSDAPGAENAHFRYEMDETYKIVMPLTATYFVTGSTSENPGEHIPVRFENVCYQSADIDEFYLASPTDYSSNKIVKFPITFVHDQSSRLLYKYCLNVKQYSMSESTYRFWKSQAENIGTSTLYSTHSFQVTGNIKNINDPDDSVLGIFEVSGVSNKRVFVDDYPYINQGMELLPQCEYETETSWLDELYGYYVYVGYPPQVEYVVGEECVNCELMGATPIEPDFWE